MGDSTRPLILIPCPRPLSSMEEWDSFDALGAHLHRYDWALIGPEPRDFRGRGLSYLATPPSYWNVGPDGRRGYSPLMVARGLYEQMRDYTHVLVYQLDAIVFADRLPHFTRLPIDYIGAPHWDDQLGRFKPGGGNGGLSLRRIDAFLEVLDGMKPWPDVESYYQHIGENEDLFWSYQAPRIMRSFRPAQLTDQVEFAWEVGPELGWLLSERSIPMGAHGYARHSPEFWDNLGGVRKLAGLPARPEPDRPALTGEKLL